MKGILLIGSLAILSSGHLFPANEPPRGRDRHAMQFKAAYDQWAAHIHANPEIRLSSNSDTYTDVPSFADIVKLGKPAVPFIADEMMRDGSDFGVFLGQAILRIQGWEAEEFGPPESLQKLNAKIIERLRNEKLIPAAKPEEAKK